MKEVHVKYKLSKLVLITYQETNQEDVCLEEDLMHINGKTYVEEKRGELEKKNETDNWTAPSWAVITEE